MQTQAAVLFEPGQRLRIVDLQVPALRAGQALVAVAYSGVCHTQLLEARGKRGEDRFLPHTLGHEGSGTVLEVGDGVTKVKPGDRVVMTWIKGRGADVPSTAYAGPQGQVNSGAISTFLRHAVVSENRLVPIARETPLREAALLGCAVPTGAGAVINAAKLRPGMSVAVFGVGGIGLSAVMAADLLHANPIIAVDIHDRKLDMARDFGATHAVNAARDEPVAAIRELTGGRGVEIAIEAAGRPESMEAAFRSVRDGGGLCILAGNVHHGERIALDPFDLIRGKRIVGTWAGETDPDREIPLYADLHRIGKLPLERLITHEYPLEDVNAALDDLERGQVGRGLIVMAGPPP